MKSVIFILISIPLIYGINSKLNSLSSKTQVGLLQGKVGAPWSYSDLFDLSSDNKIEAVSITSDGKNAIVLDNSYVDHITSENIHVVKTFPENIDTLLNSLIANHVNVDMINVEKSELVNFLSRAGDAFYNISIYFFVFSIIVQIIARFSGMPNNINNINNRFPNFNQAEKNVIDTTLVNTTFNDVAGCEEAKYELQEVVDFLKNPQQYENAGAKIPKGVLLEGSPGTGKTLLARAVAGEAGVPFLSASGSEFIELFVGVGASRVRNLFDKARESAPCVIFIDEIDAIGRKRGAGIAGGNDEREQTLNQILTNMDGFSESTGIIVLAATNRIDILDNALIRPGRFDRKVNIGLPDEYGRKQIFNVHLKNKKLDKNIDLNELSSLTTGFAGADIANLVNEGAIYSVRSNNTVITQQNLLDAYEKITIGIPSKNIKSLPEEIELVSYHEVGHAMMVAIFREMFDLRKITINENKNGAGGYTLFTPKGQFQKYPTKRFLLANIIIALGGRAAEVFLYRKQNKKYDYDKDIFNDFNDLDITTGAVNDLKQANNIAEKYITEYGFGDNLCFIDEDNMFETPFVARDMNNNNNKISDKTKCDIDAQKEYLVNFGYHKALEIVEKNENIFIKIVELLKNSKAISGKDVYKLIDEINNGNN